MPVKHLDQINIAAVDNLPTQPHVNLHIIPQFSKRLVQELIAMHLMMVAALSLAKLMNMTLFFVPLVTGTYLFSFLYDEFSHYLFQANILLYNKTGL